jgi:fructose-bisphosphate aldolase class I
LIIAHFFHLIKNHMSSITPDALQELIEVAQLLTTKGKGILASDESPSTLGKRLEKAGVSNTEENRRQYRDLFYTAPGIGEAYSGAILFPEALLQSSTQGTSFVECLNTAGVLPGVKVDQGLTPLGDDYPGETDTKGLDGLLERCQMYRKQGARFAKWRAALKVPPSQHAIEKNAAQLAEYAKICHEAGLVPLVEPELVIDGSNDAEAAEQATIAIVTACISHLRRLNVPLEAVLLKLQMVIPGVQWKQGPRPDPTEVAERTLRALRQCVPPEIPGVMFLSGGQSEVEATRNLNEINKQGKDDPWALSFSFGRALQASVLHLWAVEKKSIDECRNMAASLAKINGQAVLGEYQEGTQGTHPSVLAVEGSLQETFRGWIPPSA